MTEASRDKDTFAREDKLEPDYFGYCIHEVASLLSQSEDYLPYASQDLDERTCGVINDKDSTKYIQVGKEGNSSGARSLFSDVLGAGFSNFKKERLNALLRQSLPLLRQEVDEMEDPVFALRRIERFKEKTLTCPSAKCDDNAEISHKKLRLCSSASSIQSASPVSCNPDLEGLGNDNMECDRRGEAITNSANKRNKKRSYCHTNETSRHTSDSDGLKLLGEDCEIKSKEGKESCGLLVQKRKSVSEFEGGKESIIVEEQKTKSLLDSNIEYEKEVEEINDDLQLLLKTDSAMVEETTKKMSAELSETLERQKQKLEQLLDIIMSNYRLMTLVEKQQLQKMIRKLPPKNLNRVMEIIQRNQLSAKSPQNEIFVDLEKLDNTTLWRLYYYVRTFENARRLSSQG